MSKWFVELGVTIAWIKELARILAGRANILAIERNIEISYNSAL